MKPVFVDTSGFYAFLDRTDPFHDQASTFFLRARDEGWGLFTSSYVVHETWALIQARLGWGAVEDWLSSLLPLCEVVWVDETLHRLGMARARQVRERRLSLTDCVSFEVMSARNCLEAIADDEHFRKLGYLPPKD
ncbi:MAG: type II toxin-antitoxin system VapC family toxin [Chthoniobacterales bacterium]|nr:type II toxin-antitoxin system VapC family toxin [Chthoniobacterales bacterium]